MSEIPMWCAADLYTGIGNHAEIEGLAALVKRQNQRPTNSHIHLPPNFSAFDTVEQAVNLSAEQGLQVLGASNYYDYSVYESLANACKSQGIAPLFGTEIICLIEELRAASVKINDPGNPGKMYLCGKGITAFSPSTLSSKAIGLLETIRNNDSKRMAEMSLLLARVITERGVPLHLSEQTVKEMIVKRHGCEPETVYIQERHIAQAAQEALFCLVPDAELQATLTELFGVEPKSLSPASIQNDIRSHLLKAGKPAFVPETFVDYDHAFRLILALGGIPCYPILADGAKPLCGYEANTTDLIMASKGRNIHCVELIPVRNSPEEATRYAMAMRNAGFIVTAGTEHNTLDLIPLEPTCLNGTPIPDDVNAIFWEGACVVAAHQYLVSRGLPGYVDEDGNLSGRFASKEARIAHLHSIGAAVIEALIAKSGMWA